MFEYYEDKRGKWRWRFLAKNGKIICKSSQGYMTKKGASDSVGIIAEVFDRPRQFSVPNRYKRKGRASARRS